MKLNIPIIKLSLYLSLILVAAFIIWIVNLFYAPFHTDHQETDSIIIHWGESFTSVAKNLENRQIIQDNKDLYLVSRILGKTLDIKAGKYTLPLHSSNMSVLKAITGGKQSYIKVTIPEGFTAKRIAPLVSDSLQLDPEKFMALLTDTLFIQSLALPYDINPSLEGYLYPETYHFTYGSNEKQIITQLVDQFFNTVSDSLIQSAKFYHFDLNALVTLASIIEGEATLDHEMPVISSVYHNRLRLGMRLQADPTIQYIIKDGPRRLLNRDLEIESPYNTYLHAGLPPGPINNPGIIAIQAAANPEQTDYLYFVADGKGGHIFNATLTGHNRAKREFNQYRRQVAREKRRKELD